VSAPHRTEAAADRDDDGDGFDHLIHAPVRLRICAALDPVREVEFSALLTLLDISKSALSKHLSVLAEAGYVTQRRAVRDTRQRVRLRLTETGRSAYRGHVAALHRIVGRTTRNPGREAGRPLKATGLRSPSPATSC
jgi:DNA-binding MarR family transcriptional regulator